MLVDGLALAMLTGCAFIFLYYKLPARIRKWLQRHPLLTDAVACALTYILLGSTLTALFAAAWLGLFVSALLAVSKNEGASNAIQSIVNRATAAWTEFGEWLREQFPVTEDQEETTIPSSSKIVVEE